MPSSTARTSLRQAAARLTAIVFNPLASRPPRQDLDASVDAIEDPRGTNLIVRLATRKWETQDGAAIDPGETMIRQHPDGIEVRGWLLLRRSELLPLTLTAAPEDATSLDGLPARTAEIFILSQKDGRSYPEIAETLGMSERQVRRHMRRAIAYIAARR